jgi:hypothetical protein
MAAVVSMVAVAAVVANAEVVVADQVVGLVVEEHVRRCPFLRGAADARKCPGLPGNPVVAGGSHRPLGLGTTRVPSAGLAVAAWPAAIDQVLAMETVRIWVAGDNLKLAASIARTLVAATSPTSVGEISPISVVVIGQTSVEEISRISLAEAAPTLVGEISRTSVVVIGRTSVEEISRISLAEAAPTLVEQETPKCGQERGVAENGIRSLRTSPAFDPAPVAMAREIPSLPICRTTDRAVEAIGFQVARALAEVANEIRSLPICRVTGQVVEAIGFPIGPVEAAKVRGSRIGLVGEVIGSLTDPVVRVIAFPIGPTETISGIEST